MPRPSTARTERRIFAVARSPGPASKRTQISQFWRPVSAVADVIKDRPKSNCRHFANIEELTLPLYRGFCWPAAQLLGDIRHLTASLLAPKFSPLEGLGSLAGVPSASTANVVLALR